MQSYVNGNPGANVIYKTCNLIDLHDPGVKKGRSGRKPCQNSLYYLNQL